MGESACLMQPFSYTAGIPNEAKEGNPVHALGQSVSFGRFMSESLAWEKWSTFSSHNKYVEEAERYSRPGSVAEKKAFFEAHYKTLAARKAAALLEQANAAAAANNATETEVEGKENISDFVKFESSKVEVADSVAEKTESFEKNEVVDKAEVRDMEVREETQMEKCVKVDQSRQLKDIIEMELSEGSQMEKPLLKSANGNQDEFEVTSKRKPLHSSSTKKGNNHNLTPMARKSAMEISDHRKRSTPRSSHNKSINFTPAKEISKLTSTIIRKIDGSRIASNSKPSKECATPLRTPNMASTSGRAKQPSATPWSENRSARTPVNSSASVSKLAHGKWNFLPTDCSKFLSACRNNKSQSPGIFASFSLRTEERAARRKQRLEEKFNVSQEHKVQQQQATLKEKAETELKKLRQSFCFKARPLPDFYKERRTPKDQMQKVPLTQPVSPAIGKKSTPSKASSAQSKTSLPHHKSLVRNASFKHVPDKRNQISVRSLASRVAMTAAHENTSPNIQHA